MIGSVEVGAATGRRVIVGRPFAVVRAAAFGGERAGDGAGLQHRCEGALDVDGLAPRPQLRVQPDRRASHHPPGPWDPLTKKKKRKMRKRVCERTYKDRNTGLVEPYTKNKQYVSSHSAG
mgnify:CR=1 FL=1